MFQGRVETRLIQKIRAIHILLILALSGVAAPARAAAAQPPSLDRLFTYYQSLRDFSASFQQVKTLQLEGLALKSSGTLSVSLGHALLWSVTKPAPLSVFLDGKVLVLRSGAGAKATTTTYDLQTSALSEKIAASMKELTALLSMDRAVLEGSYAVQGDGDTLLLLPKVARQFKQVRMTLAAGAAPYIKAIAIDEVSGDRMDLAFAAPEKTEPTWIKAWTHPGG